MSVRLVSIGDVVEKISTWNPISQGDGEFDYIDLSAIDQDTKRIVEPNRLSTSEAPSRARQLVAAGDVLVSTVRPNLNGVAKAGAEHGGMTASTGFCVLRPRKKLLSENYLFQWVKSPSFVKDMVQKATGASYPAVSDRIIKESLIPLPPLDEQKRIAAILDKADVLRAKRRQASALLDSLTPSIFVEMFGSSASTTWPTAAISEIAIDIRTGPFGSQLLHSEFVDDGIAVLGIDNAVNNRFEWGKARFITEEKYRQLSRYTVQGDDVLITIMGTCGRCAVVPHDIPTAINTKHLCCITLDKERVLPDYLHACFLNNQNVLQQMGVQAKGAVMPGLNMGIIKSLEIPVPPIALQWAFKERLDTLARRLISAETATNGFEHLFASLQHRAFTGQL